MVKPDRAPIEHARMLAALRVIANDFMSPAELRRSYGLDYEETLEMAYENVLTIAKAAAKGVRKWER